MRLHHLGLVVLLSCTRLFAADPFVGTWLYNAQKSPKPTIRYAVKDLGNNRYALTGSTGVTIELAADGVTVPLQTGGSASFKKLDDRDWQLVRDEGVTMTRTFTVSGDDKTLTLHDVFAGSGGYETVAKYNRLSAGKGIVGEWQSFSVEDKQTGEPFRLTIAPYATDGLSFSAPADGQLTRMQFDGKLYAATGARDRKGLSSSGKRVSEHVLEIEDEVNGRPESHAELTVSEDGRTLTMVTRPAQSSAVFTIVCDKQ